MEDFGRVRKTFSLVALDIAIDINTNLADVLTSKDVVVIEKSFFNEIYKKTCSLKYNINSFDMF